MDRTILQSQVQRTRLLTESERAYWLAALPTMTGEQCTSLEQILREADALSWSPAMEHYMTIATKATNVLAA